MDDIEQNQGETPESEALSPRDAALEERLSQPVFQGTARPELAQQVAAVFLIGVAGLLAYANAWNAPFHYPDRTAIVENEGLHGIAALSDGWAEANIRPLTALTIGLDWRLFGESPRAFLATSIALHIAAAALLFLLARTVLGGDAGQGSALGGAILFAVHPAAAETIHLSVQRGAVLMTVFGLAAALLYARGWTAAAITCFVLAWLSDEAAWVLPLVLVAVEFAAFRDESLRVREKRLAPVFAVAVMLMIARAAGNPDWTVSAKAFLERAMTFGEVARPLAMGRALAVVTGPQSSSAAAAAVVVTVLMLGGIASTRMLPALGVGLIWAALVFLAPALISDEPAVTAGQMYIVLPGIAMAIAALAILLPRGVPRAGAGAAIAAAALWLFVGTFQRNGVWSTETSLWQDAREACPSCVAPPLRLGEIDLAEGQRLLVESQSAAVNNRQDIAAELRGRANERLAASRDYLQDALTFADAPAEAWAGLGTALRLLGEGTPAVGALRRALAMKPDDQAAALQLAVLAQGLADQSGALADRKEALDYFRYAERLGPIDPNAAGRYAQALIQMGNAGEAARVLQSLEGRAPAEQLNAALAPARAALAKVNAAAQAIDAAVKAGASPIEIDAARAKFEYARGRYLMSSYTLDRVQRTSGLDADLWYLQGKNKSRMGALEQFVADWPEPPPGDGAWRELANQCADEGLWDAARVALSAEVGTAESWLEVSAFAKARSNLQQAYRLLQRASELFKDDARPWLAMAELALDAGQPGPVQQYLSEAQRRGADVERLRVLRERAGISNLNPSERTIIR